MKKNIKELIEKALPYKLGSPLSSIDIISTDKLYNGFWGKNGYNGIIILGYYKDKCYFVNKDYECDVVELRYLGKIAQSLALEISHERNVVHIWFSNYLICFKELLSTMCPYYYGEQK